MSVLAPLPPTLAPLIGCLVALCSLGIGWSSLRTGAISPLFGPLMRLNDTLTGAVQRKGARSQKEDGQRAVHTARIFGWAWIYAGTLGLIIAGGQLVRLLTRALF